MESNFSQTINCYISLSKTMIITIKDFPRPPHFQNNPHKEKRKRKGNKKKERKEGKRNYNYGASIHYVRRDKRKDNKLYHR